MLADEVDYVIGVDTHRVQHTIAVVVAPTGAVLAQTLVRANGRGYAQALRFAERHAVGARAWAIEGAGHYGAGLTRYLGERGETVLEAGRQARTERRLRGKHDPIDAIRAARTGLAAETLTLPRSGQRQEALRVLLLTRRSAVDVRRVALVQLRSVIVTAPERFRDELRRLSVTQLIRRCSRFRRSGSRTPDELAIVLTLRSLARRIEAATAEADQLEREILNHVRALVPELLDEPGVGPIVAAQLIVTWSHHHRVRSEAAFARLAGVAPLPASSGQTIRHRLSRGGDRQLNRALHTVVSTAANTTRRHASTSLAASPRARAHATRPGSSSATSPATSTASCRTRHR
jgi:transposase